MFGTVTLLAAPPAAPLGVIVVEVSGLPEGYTLIVRAGGA